MSPPERQVRNEEVGEFEAKENRPSGRLSMDTSFCPTSDN